MWDLQDALILQSVSYAGRRGDLRTVISSADAINVAIPTREEIERSVRRLMAAGLVHPDGDRVRPTRAGKRLVRKCGRWRDGVRMIPRQLEAKLASEVPFPSKVGEWDLDESTWQDAYARYRR